MSKKIIIKNARLSFPSLFEESVYKGKKGKYQATLLIPKSDKKTYKLIMDAIEEVKTEFKKKVISKNYFIKDGDEIFEEKETDGYKGHWAIKAANSNRPIILNRDKTPITKEDNIVYAGCYVNAIITPWVQDNDWGKKVNSNLLGIQFVKDGKAFGDVTVAEIDDFQELEDESSDNLTEALNDL